MKHIYVLCTNESGSSSHILNINPQFDITDVARQIVKYVLHLPLADVDALWKECELDVGVSYISEPAQFMALAEKCAVELAMKLCYGNSEYFDETLQEMKALLSAINSVLTGKTMVKETHLLDNVIIIASVTTFV